MVEEKEGREETSGGVDEGEKKDDEGSVVFSVDEKASDSSSVKAHLSGNGAVVLTVVCTQPLSHASVLFNKHAPHPPPPLRTDPHIKRTGGASRPQKF